jgi:hypothetical protein
LHGCAVGRASAVFKDTEAGLRGFLDARFSQAPSSAGHSPSEVGSTAPHGEIDDVLAQ